MTWVVKFPDQVGARLATIAEKRGESIGDVLVEAAEYLLGVRRPVAHKPYVTILPADVARLHADGLSDAAIAEALGASHGGVRCHRLKLGLTPNTRGGRPIKTNPKENDA